MNDMDVIGVSQISALGISLTALNALTITGLSIIAVCYAIFYGKQQYLVLAT